MLQYSGPYYDIWVVENNLWSLYPLVRPNRRKHPRTLRAARAWLRV